MLPTPRRFLFFRQHHLVSLIRSPVPPWQPTGKSTVLAYCIGDRGRSRRKGLGTPRCDRRRCHFCRHHSLWPLLHVHKALKRLTLHFKRRRSRGKGKGKRGAPRWSLSGPGPKTVDLGRYRTRRYGRGKKAWICEDTRTYMYEVGLRLF